MSTRNAPSIVFGRFLGISVLVVAGLQPVQAAPAATAPAPAATAPAPATAAAAPAAAHLDLAGARVVDLSHAYGADTLYWPAKPAVGFELQSLSHGITPGGWFYASNRFCTPEHGGTHLDAPLHFAEGGWSIDQVPVERLVAPAMVIDVRAQAAEDADYRLTRLNVEAWETRNGRIPAGAIVLLRTGWGERWPDRLRYFGSAATEDASDLHFPSFGVEAVKLLLERGVVAIGLDTPSIDHGPSKDFPVHQLVGKANVAGLENLANLEQLPETGAWIVALPMKIAGGSGGPLRAVALLSQ